MKAGSKSKSNTRKTAKELEVPGLRPLKPVNDRSAAAVNYLNYCLIKNSSCYNDYVVRKLYKMAKNTAVQMKDHTWSE